MGTHLLILSTMTLFFLQIKNSFASNYMLALRSYNATMDQRSEAVDTVQKTVSASIGLSHQC